MNTRDIEELTVQLGWDEREVEDLTGRFVRLVGRLPSSWELIRMRQKLNALYLRTTVPVAARLRRNIAGVLVRL